MTRFVIRHIKSIMVIAGVVTCTMIFAAVSPQQAVTSMFGEGISGPGADVIIRNWGALIVLVGLMLIYGAFVPPVRMLVLVVAGASKVIFIGLTVGYGWQSVGGQLGLSLAFDAVVVAVFAIYLLGSRARPG